MDNLKVIENDLVPVYVTNKGEKVVNGRELHSVLQSKQDFSTWVKKRLSECDAKENKDFVRFHEKVEGNNATMIEYIILLDTGKEMAMLERNAKGKQVRRYFIKVDEKYKEEKTMPTTIQGQIQLLAQGNVEINQRIDELDNKLEKAISDLPILGIEENKISNAVRRKGVECLGGKESSAYKNRSLRQSLYSDLHKQLRREFGVTTYRAIRRNQTDTAVEIIRNYKPPLFLADQIEQENAQEKLNI